jgi:hypothetical protein
MSISGVSSSDVLQTSPAQAAQTKFQQIQSQFQKVGQDLQAGNLAASQTDFAAIQQNAQQQNSGQVQGHHHHHHGGGVSQQTGSTLQQDVTALGTALQSGNLSSAQQAYATFQADFQQAFPSSSAASGTSTTSTTNAPGTGGVNVTA